MFGGDDFFNEINRLFGMGGEMQGRHRASGGYNKSLLNTVESKKETIFIFDLSGKKVSSVEISDNVETNEYGERTSQKALVIILENDEAIKYNLPKALAKRKVSHTFTNGILEVTLVK